jgi:hypothetical protein
LRSKKTKTLRALKSAHEVCQAPQLCGFFSPVHCPTPNVGVFLWEVQRWQNALWTAGLQPASAKPAPPPTRTPTPCSLSISPRGAASPAPRRERRLRGEHSAHPPEMMSLPVCSDVHEESPGLSHNLCYFSFTERQCCSFELGRVIRYSLDQYFRP